MEERVRKIAALEFQVEIWDWTKHDIDGLVRTGATLSSMTGCVRGGLVFEADAEELLRTAGDDELALTRFRSAFTL